MDKKQLNTPIRSNVLDNFRTACNDYNLKMNVVLEVLMEDFSNGNYNILIDRKEGIKVVKK